VVAGQAVDLDQRAAGTEREVAERLSAVGLEAVKEKTLSLKVMFGE